MNAKNLGWRQKIKQHLVVTVVIVGAIVIGVALIVVIILGYRLNWIWTGLGSYAAPKKTLWDWLQLLIIPAVLAVGGFWLNQIQKRREDKTTEKRNKTERDIALDNQQEATLQEYINKMSELLLDVHRPLRKSNEDDEVQKIARVRTLTVLPRLNASRKGSLLQFLYEARLINNDESIVDLSDADLRDADLSNTFLCGAYLSSANLRGANLRDADLSYATLCSATMSGADLSGADLNDAVLNDADLRGANLHGADLSDAKLCNVTMIDADLVIATMIGADLRGADLRGADLSGADLSHAELEGTDLSRASLNGADLSLAVLFSANLEKADLSHANLEGARGFTPEALEKVAKSLEGATMPNGSIHL